jgi:hypothetical protein
MAKKQKQPRTHPQHDRPQQDVDAPTKVELTGIAQAGRELSLAVEEFDRLASSWSSETSKGKLVRN